MSEENKETPQTEAKVKRPKVEKKEASAKPKANKPKKQKAKEEERNPLLDALDNEPVVAKKKPMDLSKLNVQQSILYKYALRERNPDGSLWTPEQAYERAITAFKVKVDPNEDYRYVLNAGEQITN